VEPGPVRARPYAHSRRREGWREKERRRASRNRRSLRSVVSVRRPGAKPVATAKSAATAKPAAKARKKTALLSVPRRWGHLLTSRFRRSEKASASGKRRRQRDPVSPLTRRSRIPVALAAAFALAVLATNFPFSTLLSQHRQLSAAAAQLHQVQSSNRALSEQNEQLNSTAEIDRLARQDYQLVSPNQTLYNVLPASGKTASTTPGGPTSGDPGDQPLVAPADAPDMSPDPGLPRATPTATPSPAGGAGGRSSGPVTSAGSPSSPSSFWSRVTTTLEFWK
jgi:cell division protein FtsB